MCGDKTKSDMAASCYTGTVLGYKDVKSYMLKPTTTINYASCHDNYTIFDQYMINAANVALMDTNSLKNPSAALYTQLTSGKINLSTPSVLRNNGSAGQLYTPSTYSDGSSIYHVDQVKYKVGDANALMTPQIARGEVTRNIGPIVSSAFNDFG